MRQKLGSLSILFLICVLLLSACSSQSSPYVDRDSGTGPTRPTSPREESSTAPDTTEPETTEPETTEPETTTEPAPAICSRVDFAEMLFALPVKPEAEETENPFEDIGKNDEGYQAVMYVYAAGIMKGASSTKFKPEGEMTRSQVLTVLHKLYGKPEPVESENPFKDVKAEDKYYAPVMWALQQGMLDVPADAMFLPDDPCTVEQAEAWFDHLPEFPESAGAGTEAKEENK